MTDSFSVNCRRFSSHLQNSQNWLGLNSIILMPLIITDVKHATKSVMGESECVTSLEVLIQQCLPYRTCRHWVTREIWFFFFTHGQMRTQQFNEQWPVKYEMTTQKGSSLSVSKWWNKKLWHTNTQLLQYVQSLSDHAVVRGEETNAKDYTRSFKVGSSHMTVSSQVKSFEFAQVDLRSTWGHFSFKWGHISWPQRLAGQQ